MANELSIKITSENGLQFVSARELFEKLGCNERFSKWWNRMCSYGFIENTDYFRVYQKVRANRYGGEQDIQDFSLSMDMAKEICMLQRSEIGRKFRQYFIECEKRYQEKRTLEYKETRDKLKGVRKGFTDTLKLHGCDKFYHYINITNGMKKSFGITAKKDDMSISELTKITASEYLAEAMLCDEYGYDKVKPVCVDASKAVAHILANKKQLLLA